MRIKFISDLLENNSQESSVRSYLRIMILHMLKCKYQNDYPDKRSWRNSIKASYNKMIDQFDAIGKGSLYKTFYMKKLDLKAIYERALNDASFETGLPKLAFPQSCEWTKEQLVDEEFIYKFINKYGF